MHASITLSLHMESSCCTTPCLVHCCRVDVGDARHLDGMDYGRLEIIPMRFEGSQADPWQLYSISKSDVLCCIIRRPL